MHAASDSIHLYEIRAGRTWFARDGADDGKGKGDGDGKGKGDGDGKAKGDGDGGGEKRFSQAELDQQIENRLAEERRRRAGADGLSSQERSELERLRQERLERERKDAEAEKNYNKALESATSDYKQKEQTWGQERNTLLSELKHDRINGKIVAAAATLNAINPAQVAKLLEDRARLNDKREVEVLDTDGNQWYVGGKPASIEQLVKNYLDQNPHLVKPIDGSGSGAKGSKAGDGGDKDAEEVSLEDLKKAMEEADKEAQQAHGARDSVGKAYAARRAYEKAVKEAEAKKRKAS